MTKRAPDLMAAALETIADRLLGKITAGSQLHGTVVTNDGDLEVEITMVVRRRPTAEARIDHITQAMIVFVLESWRDRCQHYIKKSRRRNEWRTSSIGSQCQNRPTHVGARRLYTGEVAYSFCCTTHAKHETGESMLAVIAIPKARLATARTEIADRAALKAKLEKMTPVERIAQDAKDAHRHIEAAAIAATATEPARSAG